MDLETRVRAGLIETHLENNRVALPATFVVSTLVAVLFRNAVPNTMALALWWLALNLVTVLRLWHVVSHGRAPEPTRHALKLYRLLIAEAAVVGCLWGLIGTTLYPSAESALQSLAVLVIMGVAASGLVSLAPLLPAYIAFFILMLCPPIVAFALRDSYPEHLTALTLLLLTIALLLNGRRVSRNHRHSLQLNVELETALQREARARIAADAANNAKSRFLAAMSHEIRTPMNGVLGMAQLLARTELTEHQQHCLKTLKDSGRQLLGLIDEVLDFAKVESGQLQTRVAPLEVRALGAQMIAMLKPRADEKHLALLWHVSKSVPAWIEADPQRISQVLTNLLNNAIKFTDEGGVTLSIEGKSNQDGDAPIVEFSVIDTGMGIAPEHQARIFEAFVQVDDSLAREAGGVGLGLAISRDLARLMGGDLTCESTPDVGTTFRLQLPLRIPQPSQPDSPQPAAQDDAQWHFSGRVLVVEDSATNQEVAALTLQELGLEHDLVADGQEAIDRLRERRYDAILMDCQLPVMDGYEATRELRRLERLLGWPRTPVIALTANAAPGNDARCYAAGMDDFIAKPFDIDNLATTFGRWLSQKPRKLS